MGHRHLFTTSQIIQNEHDENLSHIQAVEPYITHPARVAVGGSNSHIYPTENSSRDRAHFDSNWTPTLRSSGQSFSSHNVEIPHYQPDVSGPSHDPYVHMPVAGTCSLLPEHSVYHASSSNYERPALNDGGFVDLTLSNGRGPCKRKSPGIPSGSERGSSSRYSGAGSSSDVHMFSESVHEKRNFSSQPFHWDQATMIPYGGGRMSFSDEGALRNVRSRSEIGTQPNLGTTHSLNSSNHPYPRSHLSSHCSSMDPTGLISSTVQNHAYVPPGAHGRTQVSDFNGLSHRTNHFIVGNNGDNTSVDIEQHRNDFSTPRIPPIPLNFHCSSIPTPPGRGVRSSYSQRAAPTFGASPSNLCMGRVGPSDENFRLMAENHSVRHPRPFLNSGWRNSERSGRSRIVHERNPSFPVEAGVRDRLSSEGLMILDQSTLYSSRNLFDLHRDMRLDIDNMSYEELLALGERIGHVSTGLSEDLISKCLTETRNCLSDHGVQMEGSCVICLEEYLSVDDVRMLRSCGHNYHVSCIRKWLSMKNSCPICKGSALPDNRKDE